MMLASVMPNVSGLAEGKNEKIVKSVSSVPKGKKESE